MEDLFQCFLGGSDSSVGKVLNLICNSPGVLRSIPANSCKHTFSLSLSFRISNISEIQCVGYLEFSLTIKEDEWIDGFMRGFESEQKIIAEVMSEVIDASASRSSIQEENNNDQEYQETNKFVPQENANVDHFIPHENENVEQFVPPVDQFETREEPRMTITRSRM